MTAIFERLLAPATRSLNRGLRIGARDYPLKNLGQSAITKRSLYTDTIYPYPERYVNTQKFPSQALYRETWTYPHGSKSDYIVGRGINYMMWTIMWLLFFDDPYALIGHFDIPDPLDWTNEELGIPPDYE